MIQPEFIRKALRAGKHVLAEKPIAKDVKTAKELVDWYRAEIDTSKVNWSVAENFRFYDSLIAGSEVSRFRNEGIALSITNVCDAGNWQTREDARFSIKGQRDG